MPSSSLVSFYGSLATAASIFLGILTALLVNDLSQVRSTKDRIDRQRDRNNVRRQELEARRDDHRQKIENLENKWEREDRADAQEKIAEFYNRRDLQEPAETITESTIQAAFADIHNYDSVDDLSNIEREELENHTDEIKQMSLINAIDYFGDQYIQAEPFPDTDEFIEDYKSSIEGKELEPETIELLEEKYSILEDERTRRKESRITFPEGRPGRIPSVSPSNQSSHQFSIPTSSTAIQISADRRMREQQERDAHECQLIDIRAEIKTTEQESRRLEDESESLSGEELRKTVRANFYALLASVIIPALALFLEVTGWQLRVPHWWANMYIGGIFLTWLLGFAYVLCRLQNRISALEF